MYYLGILRFQGIGSPVLIAGHIQHQLKPGISHKGNILGQRFLCIQVYSRGDGGTYNRPGWFYTVIFQREFQEVRTFHHAVIAGLTGNLSVAYRDTSNNQFSLAIGRYLKLIRQFSVPNHDNFRIGNSQVETLANRRHGSDLDRKDTLLSKLPFRAVIIHREGDAFQR